MNSIRNEETRVTSVVSLLQGIYCAILLLLVSSHAAYAASPDAWKEFQQDVREKCLDEVRSVSDVTQVFVDSIGSQSAGLALLVYATDGQSTAKQVVICI